MAKPVKITTVAELLPALMAFMSRELAETTNRAAAPATSITRSFKNFFVGEVPKNTDSRATGSSGCGLTLRLRTQDQCKALREVPQESCLS